MQSVNEERLRRQNLKLFANCRAVPGVYAIQILPRTYSTGLARLVCLIGTANQASLSMIETCFTRSLLPWRIFKSSLLLTRLSATVICFTREASHSTPQRVVEP